MNIITVCYETINKMLLTEIKADNYIFINCPRKSIFKKNLPEMKGKNVLTYNNKTVKTGAFFTSIDWNKIKPLNRAIIEKMSFCEVETMKMFERLKIEPKYYENRKRQYMAHLRYWNHILDTYNIEVFFRYSPPHMGYDNVIYHLCKLKGIKIIMLYQFYSKYAYFTYDNVRDPFPSFDIDYAIEKTKNTELKFLKSLYDRHTKKELPEIKPVVIPNLKYIVRGQRRLKDKKKLAINFYNRKSIMPDYNIKYIYFPLHYQYEGTTCPLGSVFVDQILAIEILSKLGIRIYVKEHPRISHNRTVEYYQKLLLLKNVSLINSTVDNYSLIDNSFCVSTITGTAGWEGILRGKACLMFGYHFYYKFPGVFQIDSVETAKKAFDKIKKYKPDYNLIKKAFRTFENYLFIDKIENVVKELKEKLIEEETEEKKA